MRRVLRWTLTFLAVSAITAGAVITGAPPAQAATSERFSGPDRYATSARISEQTFRDRQPDTVYLASGAAFPDAIAAGPAAAEVGAGLLITEPTRLTPVIAAELRRLSPSRIVLVGGTGAVSGTVATAARAIAPVSRIGGDDRYDTAERIVRDAFGSGADHAYIATGSNFPDALAAGPAAAFRDAPVILVAGSQSRLPADTRALLRDLGVRSVTIAGGTGVVSSGIASDLGSLLGASNVTRAAGPDRFSTAVAINADAFGAARGGLLVATGMNFPDALSVTVLAAERGQPLYLSLGYCAPDSVRSTLRRSSVERITLVGGPGAVGASVARGDACQSFSSASSPWKFVNKRNAVSVSYVPADLRVPNVARTGGWSLRSSAASALEQMIAAAQAEGAGGIGLSSGYRSAATQRAIYDRTVAQNGKAYADGIVARPGHSEHQLGLAADLYPIGHPSCASIQCIGNTAQGRWLAENSWRFGYILRYEQGMTSISGYTPEPWHFRWVGTGLAADYRASGLKTLEQFLGFPAAPTY